MKKTICALLFVLVAVTAYSQVSWNVKAGVNMSNLSGDVDTSIGVGYRFGAGMEYEFSNGFFIHPSVLVSQRTIKADFAVFGLTDEESVYQGKIKALYIDIPILLGTRLQFSDQLSMSVGIGPYFGYGVGGKTSIDELDMKEDTFGTIYLKRFDWGFDSRIAIEYSMLFLEIETQLGLKDISDGFVGNESIKNSNIILSLGCRF